MTHVHMVRGGFRISTTPTSNAVTMAEPKPNSRKKKLEMDDVFYCISYTEFALLLATATVNMLTLVVMCFMTRRQCVRDGFLS